MSEEAGVVLGGIVGTVVIVCMWLWVFGDATVRDYAGEFAGPVAACAEFCGDAGVTSFKVDGDNTACECGSPEVTP